MFILSRLIYENAINIIMFEHKQGIKIMNFQRLFKVNKF